MNHDIVCNNNKYYNEFLTKVIASIKKKLSHSIAISVLLTVIKKTLINFI